MPKHTDHPRLRSHVRKGKGGRVRVYYFYDMRPDGERDIALGTDYDTALDKWRELHLKKPQARGRLQEAIDRWVEYELPTYDNKETAKKYKAQITRVAKVLGGCTWEDVDLPMLRKYLDVRKAKVQSNREMSALSIVWGKARLWGMTRLPWPAAGVKNWKNTEQAREFDVTDELFQAVYDVADPMLKDCMDIATSTGARLTDVRHLRLPADGVLHLKASKTGKRATFQVADSPVLTAVLARRQQIQADHVMLLSTRDGDPVTASMLRGAWDRARVLAAEKYPKLAAQIKAMYLRDMRKRASDLADSDVGASELLQHSSVALTNKHYRSRVTQLKTVR